MAAWPAVADEGAEAGLVGLGTERRSTGPPHLDGHRDPEAGGRLERLQRRAVELVHHRQHGAGRVGQAGHRRAGHREPLGVGVGR